MNSNAGLTDQASQAVLDACRLIMLVPWQIARHRKLGRWSCSECWTKLQIMPALRCFLRWCLTATPSLMQSRCANHLPAKHHRSPHTGLVTVVVRLVRREVWVSFVTVPCLQARYSSLEAEYMETHLTADEGRKLRKYLSDTLAEAVASLPTPSASEVSYGGDTENEEFTQAGASDSQPGFELWPSKFGEQHIYVDVVAQNQSGLVDQEARFLNCLAQLVTCQVCRRTFFPFCSMFWTRIVPPV